MDLSCLFGNVVHQLLANTKQEPILLRQHFDIKLLTTHGRYQYY